MEKITNKDFRAKKDFKLPLSGITLTCWSSALVKDIESRGEGESEVDAGLKTISKIIENWNFYENESDENPLPINLENIKKLPAPDFEWLALEIKNFANEQKKSSRT